MEYLNIQNLIIDKYKITASLEDNTCYGVLSVDKKAKDKFLLILAGIIDNKETCFYNHNTVYDNAEYFKNRLYLDFRKKYFRTLNSDYISNAMNERFGVSFDSSMFKESINLTNLRSEVLVTDEYKFTEYGINSCGFCLLRSLNYSNIIINNPINKVRNDSNKKLIISYITNKNKFSSIICDCNNANDYKNLIDKYIIFGDYNEVYIIDPLKDTFIITDDHVLISNRIFKKDNVIVALNTVDKKEIRSMKQKYRLASFYEIGKYLDLDIMRIEK